MKKIANLELKNNLFLAPMAGYTDIAFRKMAKEYGAGLVFTEMISAKAILHNNKKTLELARIKDEERPVALQLFGDNKDDLKKAAVKIIDLVKPDLLDINMGCPAPKIALRSKSGSSLMKDPKLIGEIVKEVKELIDIPLSIKIRTGWDHNSINCVEVAKIAEANGADLIIIHGRTRSDFYHNKADWDLMKKVKESVNIPVCGNGDIKTKEDAKERLEYSKVDYLMIGRGSLGRPYIFEEIDNYLNNKEIKEYSDQEKIDLAIKHIKYSLEEKDQKEVILEFRKHLGFYLKGIKNSNKIKLKAYSMIDIYDIIKLLEEFKEEV